uniref:Uncharacterized protein LOC105056084 n=1 Tax=Elaeis guineensis var. tenera TaxID=51953 RepID=A0A6I9S3L0_ELAGV|nr:uncharacterized protein LOC105056084 [Elaeis guineensis]
MGNRKIPSSETQLGQEKRKRRREKHSSSVANRVESMEERNRRKISEEKNDVKSTNLKSTDSSALKKSSFSESRPANSRKHRRHRKRGMKRHSESGSMVCSSLLAVRSDTSATRSFLPGIVGKGHRLKNNSIRTAIGDAKGSSEKGNSALTIAAHVDLTNGNMHTEISSNSGNVENTRSNKSRRAKRRKQKDFSLSHYRTGLDQEKYFALSSSISDVAEIEGVGKNNMNASIENKSMPIATKEGGGLTKTSNDESPSNNFVSSEVHLDQHVVENPSLSQNKKATNKVIDKSLDCLDCDIKQIQDNKPNILLQLAEIGGADTSNRESASSKIRRRVRKNKASHKRHEERVSDDAIELKNEGFSQGHASPVGSNLELLATDEKQGPSLPPSPIRGVIENFASSGLPDKEDDQFHLFKKGDANFSFHVDHDLMDGISVNHSEKASTSKREAASENMKPADHKDYVSNVMPLSNHRDATHYQDESEVPSLLVNHAMEHCISIDLSRNRDKKLDVLHVSPGRSLITYTKKKLLVLDLNGVLADAVLDYRKTLNADKWIDKQAVFKRPFCDDFLNFCFEKFDIGIWSSKKKKNVGAMVDYLMGDAKNRLLFCWDRSKCTITGFSTVENVEKPLVLKEMKKLWNKEDPDLPWENGEYLPSNTLLVDDSPYKALCNPLHTAIFPHPYHFYDEGDNSIGPGGDLRVYLEGLAMADNVQHYVCAHPFGQRAITTANPSWKFYQQIIDKFGNYSSPTCKATHDL